MASPTLAAMPLPPRLRHSEGGMTLVELLLVIPLLMVTMFAIYALYSMAAKSQQRTDDRALALVQQQSGFERMSRELRQATAVTPVSSQVIDVTTWVRRANQDDAVKRRVRYECATSCRRWEGPESGSLTSGPINLISDVRNADVFTLMPNAIHPRYIAFRVEAGVRGAGKPLVLDGGFALRNHI
jgi:type II secretory pathway pseudopilin PulG